MTIKELVRLENIAENTKDEKESKQAMLKLRNINSTYHWCAEWDYMVICNNHPEFDACLCQFEGKKPKENKNKRYIIVQTWEKLGLSMVKPCFIIRGEVDGYELFDEAKRDMDMIIKLEVDSCIIVQKFG